MKNRLIIFISLNFLAILIFASLSLFSTSKLSHNPLVFLCALTLVCSFPLLTKTNWNGPYCILLIFAPLYFIYYGLTDVLRYIFPIATLEPRNNDWLSNVEMGVLVGWVLLAFGYYIAIKLFHRSYAPPSQSYDWQTSKLIWLGGICTLLGLYAMWNLQLGFADHYSRSTVEMGPIKGALLISAKMLDPVGAVLLVYAYLRERSKFLLYVFFGVCALKVPLAFVLDSKEIALQNLIIFLVAKWFYDAKVPLRWIALFFLGVSLLFPIFYAYRSTAFAPGINREKSMSNFSSNLDKALLKSDKNTKLGKLQDGILSFSWRINLKPTLATVVNNTGKGIPFQKGHTLSLLLYALIPRFILPEKEDSSIGQIFNRAFKISANPNTYISTSFLAELYWNFGWPGIVLGMFFIGMSFGLIGAKANISTKKSATRLLILISTIYLLCFRFESGIALQYTQWIRSALIIFILSRLFNRPIKNTSERTIPQEKEDVLKDSSTVGFPVTNKH